MADNALGALRRSSVIMTFAPGAIVDFRAGGASVSAVVTGLEEWDSNFGPPGLANPQVIFEERLQRKLRVAGFRLPPVKLESFGREDEDTRALAAVRFPRWLLCPMCDTIQPAARWGQDPGRAYRFCPRCSAQQPGQQKVMAIPVRFVVACSAGHLDEFPWHWWVRHRPSCKNTRSNDAPLKLESRFAGLAGLILSCQCGAERSMEHIFKKDALENLRCSGRRPWLSIEKDPDGCQQRQGEPPPELRTVQRGASNLFFPSLESALSIPPWADELQSTIGQFWSAITNVAAEQRAMFISALCTGQQAPLAEVLRHLQMTPEQLAAEIEARLGLLDRTEGEDIRTEEFRRLASGQESSKPDFEIRPEAIPADLARYVHRLVRVTRLREVRALIGFTRIYPPSASSRLAPLSSDRRNWLPAIEVRGEGIFLSLQVDRLAAWERVEAVQTRAAKLRERFEQDWHARYPDVPVPVLISPRFLLVHSLAHALIRELTFECGYSTASLRERLYVSEGEDGTCGLLIYTATADSDGTLGGLQRQGRSERIGPVFTKAIGGLEWCSSDPLCIEGAMGGLEQMSLSACHACMLLPETSCEHYNRFLDRALLVGTPDDRTIGFFSQLLELQRGTDVAEAASS